MIKVFGVTRYPYFMNTLENSAPHPLLLVKVLMSVPWSQTGQLALVDDRSVEQCPPCPQWPCPAPRPQPSLRGVSYSYMLSLRPSHSQCLLAIWHTTTVSSVFFLDSYVTLGINCSEKQTSQALWSFPQAGGSWSQQERTKYNSTAPFAHVPVFVY